MPGIGYCALFHVCACFCFHVPLTPSRMHTQRRSNNMPITSHYCCCMMSDITAAICPCGGSSSNSASARGASIVCVLCVRHTLHTICCAVLCCAHTYMLRTFQGIKRLVLELIHVPQCGIRVGLCVKQRRMDEPSVSTAQQKSGKVYVLPFAASSCGGELPWPCIPQTRVRHACCCRG